MALEPEWDFNLFNASSGYDAVSGKDYNDCILYTRPSS